MNDESLRFTTIHRLLHEPSGDQLFLRFSYVRRMQKAWKCIIWEAEEKGTEWIGTDWGGHVCASAALRKQVTKEHFEFERGIGELAIQSYHVRIGWL